MLHHVYIAAYRHNTSHITTNHAQPPTSPGMSSTSLGYGLYEHRPQKHLPSLLNLCLVPTAFEDLLYPIALHPLAMAQQSCIEKQICPAEQNLSGAEMCVDQTFGSDLHTTADPAPVSGDLVHLVSIYWLQLTLHWYCIFCLNIPFVIYTPLIFILFYYFILF